MTAFDETAALEAMRQSWSVDSNPDWSAANPAKNQCSVTALVLNHVHGGDLFTTKTDGGTHFYNRIDGKRVDLTISQFDRPIDFDDTLATAEQALADTTPERFAALRSAYLASSPLPPAGEGDSPAGERGEGNL